MTRSEQLDNLAIAYRTGVIDRHFDRPPRSTWLAYLRGYNDPDPDMPPQYANPDATLRPLVEWRLERKR